MMPGPLTVKVVWNKAVVVHGRLKKWMHSAFGGHDGWDWIDWRTFGGEKDGGEIHEHFTHYQHVFFVRFSR